MKRLLALACATLFLMSAVNGQTERRTVKLRADVWADNWFSFFLDEKFVMEDSVPITTERSFNSESFTFTAEFPFTLNFILKDFIENDTGLEYIGTRRQQLGDGGFIAQFRDADTGELIAVTNGDWHCMVTHKAPLDESCARELRPEAGIGPCKSEKTPEPQGWKSPNFDSSRWPKATIHSVAEVGPKGGYDSIPWSNSAQFIWGQDLRKDNTVLCRLTVGRKN